MCQAGKTGNQNDRTVPAPHFMSYNRGAVSTRLRVLSLRLSFGVDLNDGVALDALRVYGVAPSISTFLAGVAC